MQQTSINRTSIRYLFLGYIAFAVLGACILSIDGVAKKDISFIDALFTAASAISMTGLVVVNTGTDFSFIGQLVILLWIQMGGLGYMGIGVFIYVVIRKKIGFDTRHLLKESLGAKNTDDIVGTLLKILVFVFIIEFVGAILLIPRFALEYDVLSALWHGVFHSISAFNNAGFTTFETGLVSYRGDLWINLVITSLIILGGIGYFVILELYYFKKKRLATLSLHTKIVLVATLILIVGVALVIFLFEYSNPKSLGNLSFFEKILSAYFTSVNYRTAGFNTLDLSTFRDASLFFGSLVMVIGGNSGGTAGGIKIITCAVLLIYTYWIIRNGNVRAFRQEISQSIANRAIVICVAAGIYIIICVMLLSLLEQEHRFITILFEVCSAFATVGVSVGDGGTLSLSALFNDWGKSVIILLMITGRIGVFAFLVSIFLREKEKYIKYPEGKVYL